MLTLAYSHSLSAQPAEQSAQNRATPSITPTPTPSEEVIALRAQLDIMRQYDDRLMQTVYWALATTGTLALLVVGLGWYTNFRLYKRDVVEVKKEILNAVKQDMIRAAQEAAREATDSALHGFKKLQYQQLKQEAEKWETDGVDGNALYTYTKMIKAAEDTMIPELHIPEILNQIQRILKKKNLLESAVSSDVSVSMTKALSSLPAEYRSDVDVINQLLTSAKLKTPS